MRVLPALVAIVCLGSQSALARDAFDRISAADLQNVAGNSEPVVEIGMAQAGRLKPIGPGIEAACIVVKTSSGNWSKALLSWGFRKTAGKPVPVVIIDRFVTYGRDRDDVSISHGQNVMLFGGFNFDFDLGQIVPAEHDPDVQFTLAGGLQALANTQLYGVSGPLSAGSDDDRPDPTDHEGVLPEDFSGTWDVNADGRWIGQCELAINDDGLVSGQFFSEETKSTYPVTGKPGRLPHELRFEIRFTNSVLTFDGYLWTTDKSAMAGTATLIERKFGFYATRAETGK